MRDLYQGTERRGAQLRRSGFSRRAETERRELRDSWQAFNSLRSDTELEHRDSSGRRLFADRRHYERRMH